MASIEIYDEISFGGRKATLSESEGDLRNISHGFGQLGNWNDEIQSFKVISGTWRLFEHTGFGGLGTQPFKAGASIANCQDAGFPNKWVSSVQKISD
jgi:hypothetical protein